MAKPHSVRDPVHNFIRLRDRELKLADTPVFQRLRGIRQLALANLVYPSALHTRFEHSLGVCHVAGLMAEELGVGSGDTELVRYAAQRGGRGHQRRGRDRAVRRAVVLLRGRGWYVPDGARRYVR